VATLVLLRHGQSSWNLENRFTGWYDCDLSAQGEQEARASGRQLRDEGVAVDVAHTSVLLRAIRTLHLALEELGRTWIPEHRHWRLNERHYGNLTGLDKAETKEKYGESQFLAWRRSYDIPPPPIDAANPWNPNGDDQYRALAPDVVPSTECLKDVVARMLPYWYDAIVPDLRADRVTLVAAHGNSLRALIKHLDGIGDEEIPGLEIPTGVPIVYELDEQLRPVQPGGRWLGDPEAIRAAAEAVRRQGDHMP
jgi:2,3-bisphosphoglycerate-dependent phosphoglycerate mutase